MPVLSATNTNDELTLQYYPTRNLNCVFRRQTLVAVVVQFFEQKELENNANYSYCMQLNQRRCTAPVDGNEHESTIIDVWCLRDGNS